VKVVRLIKICLLHFLFRMDWSKEMLSCHYFFLFCRMSGTIPLLSQYAFMACCSVKKKAQGQLYILLGTFKKIWGDGNWMGHISFWFMLMLVKEFSLQANSEKTNIHVHHQNAGQYHNISISNKSLIAVTEFPCLGKTVRNQNCIYEENENVKFWECLLAFSSVSFDFLFPVWKCRD